MASKKLNLAMAKQEIDQSPFITRGLEARNQARETGGYVSLDQVMAELTLMLKQAQRREATKTPQGSPQR